VAVSRTWLPLPKEEGRDYPCLYVSPAILTAGAGAELAFGALRGASPPLSPKPRPLVILNEAKDLPATIPERCFTSFSITAIYFTLQD
jgi:hypothetical protein